MWPEEATSFGNRAGASITCMGGSKMRVFATTSERGLNQEILPMRLYHKAKKLGIWDPKELISPRTGGLENPHDGPKGVDLETLLLISSR